MPYCPVMRLVSEATISSASSQLIRTHWSRPRRVLSPPPGAQFCVSSGISGGRPRTPVYAGNARADTRAAAGSQGIRHHIISFCLTTTPSATSALLTQRPPQLCQQATGFHCPLAAGAAAGVVCAGAGWQREVVCLTAVPPWRMPPTSISEMNGGLRRFSVCLTLLLPHHQVLNYYCKFINSLIFL